MNEIPVAERREGVFRGGYIAVQETADLDTILIATGSELQHAIAAASELGAGVRVVSHALLERFDRQPPTTARASCPPPAPNASPSRPASPASGGKYVGSEGKVIGIDRFGISAPGDTVMKELGITAANIVATAKSMA